MPDKRIVPERSAVEVTFTLPAHVNADKVEIFGDFTDWRPHPMERGQDGGWTATLELPPGRSYQFRYRLDDSRWENDWAADEYVPNDHGGDNSVVHTPSLDAMTLEGTAGRGARADGAAGKRAAKSPGRSAGARGAVKSPSSGAATAPGKKSAAKSPAKAGSAKSPSKGSAKAGSAKSPAKSSSNVSAAKSPAKASSKVGAAKSPATSSSKAGAGKTATRAGAAKSPARKPTGQTGGKGSAKSSQGKGARQSSPGDDAV